MAQIRRTVDQIRDQRNGGLVQSSQQNTRWRDRRQSTNVEDRRGMGGRNMAIGGDLGLGTILVVLLVLLLGGNPADVLQQLPLPGAETSQTSVELTAGDSRSPTVNRKLCPIRPSQSAPREKLCGRGRGGWFHKPQVMQDPAEVWSDLFRQKERRHCRPKDVSCQISPPAFSPNIPPTNREKYDDGRRGSR